MNHLRYLNKSTKWIRLYYSVISDWDKALTATVFAIVAKENIECIIIVAIDV